MRVHNCGGLRTQPPELIFTPGMCTGTSDAWTITKRFGQSSGTSRVMDDHCFLQTSTPTLVGIHRYWDLGGKRKCAQTPSPTCIPFLISADIPVHPCPIFGGEKLSKPGFQRPLGASEFSSFMSGHPNSISLDLGRNQEPSLPRQL